MCCDSAMYMYVETESTYLNCEEKLNGFSYKCRVRT